MHVCVGRTKVLFLLLKSRNGMRVSNQEAAPVTSGGIYGADDRSESETALIRSGSVGSSAP